MIEALSRGQRITVIEQAVPPEAPRSPNRSVIALAGFLAGMMLGVALLVLREVLNRSVRRPQDLEKGLQITTFAVIPYITTQPEQLRRRSIVLGTGFALAIGVPAILWYVDQQVAPLQPIVERVFDKVGLGHFF